LAARRRRGDIWPIDAACLAGMLQRPAANMQRTSPRAHFSTTKGTSPTPARPAIKKRKVNQHGFASASISPALSSAFLPSTSTSCRAICYFSRPTKASEPHDPRGPANPATCKSNKQRGCLFAQARIQQDEDIRDPLRGSVELLRTCSSHNTHSQEPGSPAEADETEQTSPV